MSPGFACQTPRCYRCVQKEREGPVSWRARAQAVTAVPAKQRPPQRSCSRPEAMASLECSCCWGLSARTRVARRPGRLWPPTSQARRRWRLMLKCVPEPAERGFRGALGFLVAMYAPRLAGAAAGGAPAPGSPPAGAAPSSAALGESAEAAAEEDGVPGATFGD